MASYNPVVKNDAGGAILYVALRSAGTANIFQSNPTLAAGDAKVSIDGAALANLGTLPAVTPASGKVVKITLSQAEINGDNIFVILSDAAGNEWCDLGINIQTVSGNFDKIYSDTTHIDLLTGEGDFSDILSRLTVTNSQLLIVKSDTSDIRSHIAVWEGAAGLLSDIASGVDVIQTVTSDIQSDTNVMVPIISDIQSDTNVLITKMQGLVLATGTVGATGNDTTHIHMPGTTLDSIADNGLNNYNVVLYDNSVDEYHVRTITAWTNSTDLATVSPAFPAAVQASTDLYWLLPPLASQIDGDISDVLSRLTVQDAVISDIQSDTNVLITKVTEADFSDILSAVTIVKSQTTVIKSDTISNALIISDIRSQTVVIKSDVISNATRATTIASNVLIVKSDTSDVLSRLTSYTAAAGILSDINSGVDALQVTTAVAGTLFELISDIYSDTTYIETTVSDIQSDTNVMVPIVSDIQSDTNVLITKMRGVVLATGTIGATGNTTTVVHIPDTTMDSLSDNEINNYNLILYDNSTDEYHARTITTWTASGALATVAPAFPFTPEASVDLYWVLPPWANQFDGDISDIRSSLTALTAIISDIQSDTNVMVPIISDIQSDTNLIITKLTEADTSDILSMLTAVQAVVSDIQSDTNVLLTKVGEADWSDILSAVTIVKSQTTVIKSDLISNATIISDIQSDTNVLITTIGTAATGILSDINSGINAIQAAGAALTSDQDSKLTAVTTTLLSGGTLFEMVSDVYSDTTAIEAQAGASLTSDQDSKLTRVANAIVEVDTSDIMSKLTIVASQVVVVKSDTAHIESDVISNATRIQQIQSDTISNALIISDIRSQTVIIKSDVISNATRATTIASNVLIIKSDTSDIKSHEALWEGAAGLLSDIASGVDVIQTVTSDIQSDTNVLITKVTEADWSDILSAVTIVKSQTTVIKSDTISNALIISDIQSDTNALLTKVGEGDWSDILSRLVVTNSQIVVVKSDAAHIESAVVVVKSKTDSLTFTTPGQVDANIQSVNDTAVSGTGTPGDEWGP